MKIERKTMLAIRYALENLLGDESVKKVFELLVDSLPNMKELADTFDNVDDETLRHVTNLYKAYIKITQED